MATFKEYLRFTDEMEYMDKQIRLLGEVNLSEDQQEELEEVDKEINLLVFAHPKCPDCSIVIAVLEAMRRFIPSMNVDYRKRSEDKELLLQYSPEGKIPTLFIVDGIKVTRIFSEYPENLKELIQNSEEEKEKFHKGMFNEEIYKQILGYLR
ncbi:thioredoxin family protein [Streptobacillus felis]|uniref:Thioredoxin family protein n=1 Tax=Streptobacillus felis TaxID=1384509 RepID=A0A7Z0TBM4_9FUSO|nr:thioredoxin family protein [Streptobacillus felis]NYV27533.1 thioredoxin family protein [Streptobacillus felis]